MSAAAAREQTHLLRCLHRQHNDASPAQKPQICERPQGSPVRDTGKGGERGRLHWGGELGIQPGGNSLHGKTLRSVGFITPAQCE